MNSDYILDPDNYDFDYETDNGVVSDTFLKTAQIYNIDLEDYNEIIC